MVNEPSVFELLRFYCSVDQDEKACKDLHCQSVLDLQLSTFLQQCMCPNAEMEEYMSETQG